MGSDRGILIHIQGEGGGKKFVESALIIWVVGHSISPSYLSQYLEKFFL